MTCQACFGYGGRHTCGQVHEGRHDGIIVNGVPSFDYPTETHPVEKLHWDGIVRRASPILCTCGCKRWKEDCPLNDPQINPGRIGLKGE